MAIIHACVCCGIVFKEISVYNGKPVIAERISHGICSNPDCEAYVDRVGKGFETRRKVPPLWAPIYRKEK